MFHHFQVQIANCRTILDLKYLAGITIVISFKLSIISFVTMLDYLQLLLGHITPTPTT